MNRNRASIAFTAFFVLLGLNYRLPAQTGGPVQPEAIGIGSASSGPNVDQFTGAFSYSVPVLTVPGPHGSSFTMSLTYSSTSDPDLATWVGAGFNLGAGSIVRSTRGFPDDWKDSIEFLNKGLRSWSITASDYISPEILSKDGI